MPKLSEGYKTFLRIGPLALIGVMGMRAGWESLQRATDSLREEVGATSDDVNADGTPAAFVGNINSVGAPTKA